MSPVALCDLVRFLPPHAGLWAAQAAARAAEPPAPAPPPVVDGSAFDDFFPPRG